MGFRILRPTGAFELGAPTIQKRPRIRDGRHLAFIASLPCLITGTQPVEACHVSYVDRSWGKRERGKGEKTSDWAVVPMCADLHRLQHSQEEKEFWKSQHIDPLKVAAALWIHSGDIETCEIILREARNRG